LRIADWVEWQGRPGPDSEVQRRDAAATLDCGSRIANGSEGLNWVLVIENLLLVIF
jgi:hypothetical protein